MLGDTISRKSKKKERQTGKKISTIDPSIEFVCLKSKKKKKKRRDTNTKQKNKTLKQHFQNYCMNKVDDYFKQKKHLILSCYINV